MSCVFGSLNTIQTELHGSGAMVFTQHLGYTSFGNVGSKKLVPCTGLIMIYDMHGSVGELVRRCVPISSFEETYRLMTFLYFCPICNFLCIWPDTPTT